MSATDVTFTGSIPALYDRYLGPLLFEIYAADLAGRVTDLQKGRLLETAAGTGIVTRALVERLPSTVEIVATDLNPAMLEVAATRVKEPNVRWQPADAQALPFGDGEFDAVLCQFGVMFFPDKPAGYREARRVLKPGGRFLFSVWGELQSNPVSEAVSDAVAASFPADPPRFFARTPFGYADPDGIRRAMEQAGFGTVTIEAVEKVTCTSAREAALGLCQGTPLAGEIEARRPGGLAEVTEQVAEALESRFGPQAIENRMKAYVIDGRS